MTKIQHSKKYIFTLNMLKTFIYLFLGSITLIVMSYAAFRVIYIQTSVIGFSMQPTLNNNVLSSRQEGDIVFVNRFVQGKVSDIVVANVPWSYGSSNTVVIKRLVAVGGDRVKFVQDDFEKVNLYKNGELYDEPYVTASQKNEYINWQRFLTDNKDYNWGYVIDKDGYLVIPKNCIYILGDNRAESIDCSREGPISRDSIVGKVSIIVDYGDEMRQSVVKQLINIMKWK